MSLFSPDSKIMQALSRVCDLVLLNLLFIVTCLPIFTIGTASTALYSVCCRMVKDEDGGIFRQYFRSFRENFRQSTVIFLLLLVFTGLTAFDLYFFSLQTAPLYYLHFLSYPLLILAALVYSYAFPLLSQFGNTIGGTLKNALLLGIGYLPRSLCMMLLNLLPLGLLLLMPQVFFQISLLWVFLYYAATAYVNALLLKKVFAPFLKEAGCDV